tara:strand:- start:508 stop:1206 length:699 start_codon:yes stop_codon:yes gene_type:complete
MIPKIIHNVGPADRSTWPTEWHVCLASQKKHFKDFEFVFWDDDMMDELVEKEFPSFLKTWNEYPHVIMKSDMIRPIILYLYGGIYFDLDIYCEENIYSDLDQDKINIHGSWDSREGHPPLTNAFLASKPKNDYWLKLIKSAEERWNGEMGQTLKTCGPTKYEWSHECFVMVLRLTGPMLLGDLPETQEENVLNSGKFSVEYVDNPIKHLCTGSWWNKRKYDNKKISHIPKGH